MSENFRRPAGWPHDKPCNSSHTTPSPPCLPSLLLRAPCLHPPPSPASLPSPAPLPHRPCPQPPPPPSSHPPSSIPTASHWHSHTTTPSADRMPAHPTPHRRQTRERSPFPVSKAR